MRLKLAALLVVEMVQILTLLSREADANIFVSFGLIDNYIT